MVNIETLESLTKINLIGEEKTAAVEYFDFWTKKFDALADIATENVEPLITVSSLENVMRDDVSFKMISRETLLENSPEQHNGHFVVPRILE